MYTMISQVINDGTEFGSWSGKNTRRYMTSNRLIVKYRELGIDSLLNSPTIKQLAQYNAERLAVILQEGVTIAYQTHLISLTRVAKNSILVNVVNVRTGNNFDVTLSQRTMKDLVIDNGAVNHDVLDLIQALYEKVLA